jgi:hypothetical protein
MIQNPEAVKLKIDEFIHKLNKNFPKYLSYGYLFKHEEHLQIIMKKCNNLVRTWAKHVKS